MIKGLLLCLLMHCMCDPDILRERRKAKEEWEQEKAEHPISTRICEVIWWMLFVAFIMGLFFATYLFSCFLDGTTPLSLIDFLSEW